MVTLFVAVVLYFLIRTEQLVLLVCRSFYWPAYDKGPVLGGDP